MLQVFNDNIQEKIQQAAHQQSAVSTLLLSSPSSETNYVQVTRG